MTLTRARLARSLTTEEDQQFPHWILAYYFEKLILGIIAVFSRGMSNGFRARSR
jgi:hypothetical protein